MPSIERVARLSRADFEARFLRAGPPVVVTGQLADWPSAAWTFDDLRERWGRHQVSAWVTAEGEWSHQSQRQMVAFSELLDATIAGGARTGRRISGPQMDLKEDAPWAADAAITPPFVPEARVIWSNLWVQAAGDRTHLHWDIHSGALALLRGRKDITLYPPSDWQRLYPIGSGEGVNWSKVDVFRVDDTAFPLFREATPYTVTLEPGEILFVPQTWWHCVETTEASIGVNYWWHEPDAIVAETYRRVMQFNRLVAEKAGAKRP